MMCSEERKKHVYANTLVPAISQELFAKPINNNEFKVNIVDNSVCDYLSM